MSDIEKEMKHYHHLHQIEQCKNYNNKIHKMKNDDKNTLAEYIHNNYDKLDETEMKIIVLKCLDQNSIKKILLSFELENYQELPVENMSLTDFTIKAQKILQRYQCRAGGFNVEDIEWIIHKVGSIDHEVMDNEILFVNTIAVCDEEDDELEEYLNNIIKRLNSIAKNIIVEIREDRGKRNNHLLIWATDISQEVVVGL